jgi:predicted metal-dependent RNase
MKVFDSTTRAYRLDGGVVSEESLDVVLNAAYAMLAKNDEIAPPFEDWEDAELTEDGESVVSYSAVTDTGSEIRISFHFKDMTAKIMLCSPEEELFVGDELLCIISSADKKYTVEEWL